MKDKQYIPRFISIWNECKEGLEIKTLKKTITFEGMTISTVKRLEDACSGEYSLEEVTKILSKEWGKENTVSLLNYLIDEGVIINSLETNPVSISSDLKKIETILPNKDVSDLFKLQYEIIYGRTGLDIWSSGKGLDLEIACKKLVSEIAEWGAWSPEVNRITTFSDYESIASVVNPEDIVSYHDEQYLDEDFNLERFNSKSVYEWVEADDVRKGGKTLILADHILYPYSPKHQRYCFTTSTGCAAHVNKTEAIKHAVYEIIERDSFMIYWLNKLDRPNLDIETLPENVITRIKLINDCGFNVVVKDISLDLSPVILIAVQDKLGNYITIGLGSSYDIECMISSALSEAEDSVMHFLNSKNKSDSIDPCEVLSLRQHEELHRQEKYQKHTQFIFDKRSKTISYDKFCSQHNESSDVVQSVFDNNLDIYVIDATKWGIDILLPEHRYIVRVVIPGLVPLSFGYGLEPLGMDRIYTIPYSLGQRSEKIVFREINRFPHPFN